jgi:hypothetical protein
MRYMRGAATLPGHPTSPDINAGLNQERQRRLNAKLLAPPAQLCGHADAHARQCTIELASGCRAGFGCALNRDVSRSRACAWIENDQQFMAVGGTGECWIDVMPSRDLVIAVLGIGFQLGGGGSWSAFQPIVDSVTD